MAAVESESLCRPRGAVEQGRRFPATCRSRSASRRAAPSPTAATAVAARTTTRSTRRR